MFSRTRGGRPLAGSVLRAALLLVVSASAPFSRASTAVAAGAEGNFDIWVLRLAGGTDQLTWSPAGDFHPTWRPDGASIAFTSIRDGDYDVYVMNPDGTGVLQLTNDAAADTQPRWSPDGTRIWVALVEPRRGADRVHERPQRQRGNLGHRRPTGTACAASPPTPPATCGQTGNRTARGSRSTATVRGTRTSGRCAPTDRIWFS